MNIHAMIAKAITRERNRTGISLSALADKAGIAKSTLSQLEAGKANPNIETLWAIATALDVPFNYLFETPQDQTALVRADDGQHLSSASTSLTATLLADCPPHRRRVLYRLDLQQNPPREAAGHHDGTIEHAFVCAGRVRVGPMDCLEDLGVGDYYRYPADDQHLYESLTETAMLLLVIDTLV